MSFLRFFLMSWLASKAMENLEQKVAQTIHENQNRSTNDQNQNSTRNSESSRSSSSSSKSKESSSSHSSTDQTKSEKRNLTEIEPVEIGFVFAMPQELVGILDQMKSTKITQGNGFKYYSGFWKKQKIVLVESGVGQKKSKEATEALIQIFRPQRIISAGFAGSLVASLSRFQMIVPHFLIRESDGQTLNLWENLLDSPQASETVDSSLSTRKPVENSALSVRQSENDGKMTKGENGSPDSFRNEASLDDISSEYVERTVNLSEIEKQKETSQQDFQARKEKADESQSSESFDPKPINPKAEKSSKSSNIHSYFLTGTLLTTDRVITKPSDKESLAQKFNASLVDMETWAVAKVCQNLGVPFLSIRIILDPLDQELPKEIQNLTHSSQNKARLFGALCGAVFKRPASVVDMFQLKQNALIAADKIALAVEKIISLK
ncbi:MAG: hypothetical protein Q4C95_01830 [Planctomycetia bacterium]|nr:hypothetical protein [Planctomycetia bacterium]